MSVRFADCWRMTYVDYLEMVHERNRALNLMPSLLVLMLGCAP
jgi:hypothetical protein